MLLQNYLYVQFLYFQGNHIDFNQICSMFGSVQDMNILLLRTFYMTNKQYFSVMVRLLRSLDIRIRSTEIIHPVKLNINGYLPIKTGADGNCLYRAVSRLIFSSENLYKLIKLSAAFINMQYEDEIKNILKETRSLISFESLTKNLTANYTYGNEFNILSLSILFNRPIFVYSDLNTHHNYTLNKDHAERLPLCLMHINNNHFISLMPTNKTVDLPFIPEWNQFKNFNLNIK
jgi:hypothetical protein